MAEVIRMPKMSDTMEEGVIAAWHKKVGDKIKSGDILADVETDKATMELESYEEGTLIYVGVKEGDAIPVNGILAIVGEEGEDYKALLEGNDAEPKTDSSSTTEPAVENIETKVEKAPAAAPVTPAKPINATIIRMPKMSDTMTEGVLVSWQKQIGDQVKSGDILAEVETDKATMDLEAYEEGTLLYQGVEPGNAVPIDGILAIVGEKGADFEALLKQQSAEPEKSEAVKELKADESPAAVAPAVSAATASDERLKASPLAKRLAEEKGIDIRLVTGSGDQGRIIKRDVDNFVPTKAKAEAPSVVPAGKAPAAEAGAYQDLPLSQMRKTIARRLSESLFTAPHFYVTMEINMDKAMALRPQLNEASPVKISFNDMVIKAAALALKKHPEVNSAWMGDKIRRYNYVNVGVAVAVDEGLLVPVIREADRKPLSVIAAEVKELAGKAKEKKLQPSEWEGNTFSVSNLGMFGVDEFTAIINPPDSCILAVGGIKKVAAFNEDGSVYPVNIMKVTLSSDHRVVDGALSAVFLQTLKSLLENPLSMLI